MGDATKGLYAVYVTRGCCGVVEVGVERGY